MSEWETFCDKSYYHLWRVRRKNERGFDDGYHIHNGEEARDLVELLNGLERERDEARNAMAQAQGELDLKTLDFERMREQRDQLLKQLAAMESAGAEQARRADENREWSLKVERERDAERALADRLADCLNNLWHHHSLTEASYDYIDNALAAWKEARSE